MPGYRACANRISYRRYCLNQRLSQHQELMRGVVVDLGGQRQRSLNFFQPPEAQAHRWVFINIDLSSRPDMVGSVIQVPVRDGAADMVICTEVLEHLERPEVCVQEAGRILKPGGIFMGSVPFIYPLHPDPDDYSRFTEQRIRRLCRNFARVEVFPMGGYLGTVGLLIERGVPAMAWPSLLRAFGLRIGRWLCTLDDRGVGRMPEPVRFTTGYFWVAWKT